jgi:succinoglycan biosynthesis transport protein ExoP
MDRSDFDHDSEEESSDLPAFFTDPRGVINRRWRYMAVAAALGLIATVTVVSQQTAVYTGEATLLIKRQRIPENLVRSTVQEDSFQALNALLGEVLSREKLKSMITKMNLYPELRETITMDEVIALMRSEIDISAREGLRLDRRQEGARIIVIHFDDADRTVAADVANALAHAITDESLRSRSEQARVTTDFLRREFERSEDALEEQNHFFAKFQQKYQGELPSELESNLRHLQRLQEQRQSLALQISESESRLASITLGLQEGRHLSPSEERLEELRDKLAEVEGLYTAEHPAVLSTRRQIEALEKIIAERKTGSGLDHNSFVKATQNEIRLLRLQASEVETDIVSIEERVARTPVRREEQTKFEQTLAVLNENYMEALHKVKEAELSQNLETAQQGSRLSLLDKARPPTHANGKRLKYALAGLAASLGLAVLIGCILEMFDPFIISARQVEKITSLPVLGVIPKSS